MKNKIIFFIFGIIILSVIFPLLKPGYIFSLDGILNFNPEYPKIGSNIFWVIYLIKFFNFFGIPIWILEKILIIFTFILPLIGGYLLTKDTKNNYSIVFCMLFLIFNPFLYGRFLDGQINIYLSYALYPLFFYFLKNTFENLNFKNIFIVSFFTLILCLTSIHNAIFLFFIFLLFFIFYFSKIGWKNILKIGSIVFFINLLWFLPFIFSGKNDKFDLLNQVQNFGQDHINEFKTLDGDLNIYLNLISLNGYWGENEKRFVPVTEGNFWFLFFILFFLISLSGFFSKIEKNEISRFDLTLFSIGIISFIFAFGIEKNSIFSFINNLMYEYFPMYSGMREPHKWIMFLVIFYAYFGAFGIKNIFSIKIENKILKNFREIFVIFLVLVPIFYVPNTLLGFNSQVKISYYPETWKEIKDIYKIDFKNNCEYKKIGLSEKCYDSLAFPWHHYMKLKFTEKIVGSWIFSYFSKDILYGDNIEKGYIYTESTRLESKIIERYIGENGVFYTSKFEENLERFFIDLKGLGIKKIFLFKEVDYKIYEKILEISEKKGFVKIIKENSDIILYEVNIK